MADSLTKSERSERMSRVRAKDTKPELTVRRLVHGMGYRYRLHVSGLPGTPDIVLPRLKKAIFVHGCFWHRHPDPTCKLARLPKSNLDFWKPKLTANRIRDHAAQIKLRELGWDILTIWECQIGRPSSLKETLCHFLEDGVEDR